MPVEIVCIVEGHGECESVPILIRRIAERFDPGLRVQVPHPIRVTKRRLLKQAELERAVGFAAVRAASGAGILVLLDADDDCPAELGPSLLARVQAARIDRPSAVVLANKEFESWFLAAAESLRGHKGLPADLERPENPEAVRGAKEWLNQRIRSGAYSPTVDQPSFSARFDLEAAKRAPSFEKCYREVTRLLTALRG
jgi:hypothetical protein